MLENGNHLYCIMWYHLKKTYILCQQLRNSFRSEQEHHENYKSNPTSALLSKILSGFLYQQHIMHYYPSVASPDYAGEVFAVLKEECFRRQEKHKPFKVPHAQMKGKKLEKG